MPYLISKINRYIKHYQDNDDWLESLRLSEQDFLVFRKDLRITDDITTFQYLDVFIIKSEKTDKAFLDFEGEKNGNT